ncbi:NUDIX hydrolase [Longispora fulva]|nr:NUDIX hydrolase [Longispora fulva]
MAVTVDLVVLTIRDGGLRVLLIERGNEPFRGEPALPGGFLRPEEDLDAAAARELEEETGLRGLHLEQIGAYGAPDRDPRQRIVTVAYLAIMPDLPEPLAGSDASGAAWTPAAEALDGRIRLAFDHADILADAVELARTKLEQTTLATVFCPAEFTIAELRGVYETVWNTDRIDPRNFHRKVLGAEGFVEATGERRALETGRPASLYRRAGEVRGLYPPMLRP